MGVPCAGCGRDYDVTLFSFGRTLECACGTRVGIEPRVRLAEEDGARLLTDSMLARLARWLRLMGLDCAHHEGGTDEQLVRRAMEERRIILTRDGSLCDEWRVTPVHVVEARTPLAQLREVVEELDVADRLRPLSRCSRCNVELAPVPADAVAERLPDDVVRTHAEVGRCPSCHRLYWEGRHADRIREVATQVGTVTTA